MCVRLYIDIDISLKYNSLIHLIFFHHIPQACITNEREREREVVVNLTFHGYAVFIRQQLSVHHQ